MLPNHEVPPDGVHHGAVPSVRRSKLSLSKWRKEKAALLGKTDVSVSSCSKAGSIFGSGVSADQPSDQPESVVHPDFVDDNDNVVEVPDVNISNNHSQNAVKESDVVVQQHNNNMVNDRNSDCKALLNLMISNDWFAALTSLELNPDVAFVWCTTADFESRFLPIHAAIILKAPSLIVSHLLSVHPKSALSRNEHGFIPLHLAVLHGSTQRVFFELLNACPESIDVTDNNGLTPSHYHLEACRREKRKNDTENGNEWRDIERICSEPINKAQKPMPQDSEEVMRALVIHKFRCRFSCDRIFPCFDCRRHHETLCWLKTPFGSILHCEFCRMKVQMYSYETLCRHEDSCTMSGYCRKEPHTFADGSIPFNVKCTSLHPDARDAPICNCAVKPTNCVVSVSASDANPGRKYYRCSKFNRYDQCNFFLWLKDHDNN